MSDSFSQPVDVKITVQIGARFEGPDLIISFRYNPAAYHGGESGVKIPLSNFRKESGEVDSESLSRFFARVLTDFELTKAYALERDLQLHFADVVRLLTASDGMGSTTVPDTVKELSENHKKAVADSLHRMMQTMSESDRKPKHSRHWAAITLTAAIAEANAALRPHQDFNYRNIYNRLKEHHPKTSPPTIEAFKKLTKRLGIQWKTLKAQASAKPTQVKEHLPANKKDTASA